jgi:hypothetical protein
LSELEDVFVPHPYTPVGQRSSSSDRMLLIGGLALVVLILTDTVFLTLSSRAVR